MNETYHRLRAEDRKVLGNMRKEGFTQKAIAVALGCSQNAVCKELARNCGQFGYRPSEAS